MASRAMACRTGNARKATPSRAVAQQGCSAQGCAQQGCCDTVTNQYQYGPNQYAEDVGPPGGRSRIPITRTGVRATSWRGIRARSVRDRELGQGSGGSQVGERASRCADLPGGSPARVRRIISRRVSGGIFPTGSAAAFFVCRPRIGAVRSRAGAGRRISSVCGCRQPLAPAPGRRLLLVARARLSLRLGPTRETQPTPTPPQECLRHEFEFQEYAARFHQDDGGAWRRLLGCRSGERRRRRRRQQRLPIARRRRFEFACIGVGGKGDSDSNDAGTPGQHRGDLRRRRRPTGQGRAALSRREEVLRLSRAVRRDVGTDRRRHGEHSRPHACRGRGPRHERGQGRLSARSR